MKYDFIDLPWDTEYFGVKSGKVVINEEIELHDIKEIIRLAEAYEFITINNINNQPLNNFLIGKYTNAFIVDTNVQFEMNVQHKKGENYFDAMDTYKKNIDLIKIAENSFNFSRFYNDPFLNIQLSKQLYSNWINNSFSKKEKYFIVAEVNEEILGYLLFSFNKSDALTIELISLDKTAQGKGIGTKLLDSLVYFAGNNNIHKIKVGTQIDNLQAINFYMKKGFSLSSKSSIYHFWPRKELLND
ncbi:GNAT family N-acetyltransferase [Planococcus sp. ANT_H30]|uniref:GNAT family N-acetyltransferase n=1 Tax=Planococcus sp. ANT_H30 TaxID=2597347 RepID=UPI00165E244A|nr:GNAT family N-acetyltransferase [Planococcus sp. ANT_H30]